MSLALVEDLATATAQLRGAMQRADLSEIEKAMAGFRESMEAVQAVGAWKTDPVLKARVKEIVAELESSRVLASLMGDMTGQLHDAAAARDPNVPQTLYGRR